MKSLGPSYLGPTAFAATWRGSRIADLDRGCFTDELFGLHMSRTGRRDRSFDVNHYCALSCAGCPVTLSPPVYARAGFVVPAPRSHPLLLVVDDHKDTANSLGILL